MHHTVETTLSAAVASAGTITFGYPTDAEGNVLTLGNFENTRGHKMWAAGHQKLYDYITDFTIAFGASVVVTYNGSTTIPAGSRVSLQLNRIDKADELLVASAPNAILANVAILDLGSPDAADTDAFIKAATGAEAPNANTKTYTPDTNGVSPTDGVGPVVVIGGVNYWEMDVPRNLTSTVTHATSVVAMTWTVTGLDEYGNTVVETVTVAATGTSQADATLKAFKHIRSIALTAAADATANTVNVGFGDVLGLPVRLPDTGYVLKELEDGAAPTAGTVVAGVVAAATATTGDVRGTYDPNSACDGTKAFKLITCIPDMTDKGVAQFAG